MFRIGVIEWLIIWAIPTALLGIGTRLRMKHSTPSRSQWVVARLLQLLGLLILVTLLILIFAI